MCNFTTLIYIEQLLFISTVSSSAGVNKHSSSDQPHSLQWAYFNVKQGCRIELYALVYVSPIKCPGHVFKNTLLQRYPSWCNINCKNHSLRKTHIFLTQPISSGKAMQRERTGTIHWRSTKVSSCSLDCLAQVMPQLTSNSGLRHTETTPKIHKTPALES